MSTSSAKGPATIDNPGEPTLRPANENPWYLLATLYGEPPEGADLPHFNRRLKSRNRLAWNRYMATIADPDVVEQASRLTNADGSRRISSHDLQPYSPLEMAEMKRLFIARGGAELPTENTVRLGSINFLDSYWFARDVVFDGGFYGRVQEFSNATFFGFAYFSGAKFGQISDFHISDFRNAVFCRNAWFTGATFGGEADFSDATFAGPTWFGETTFSAGANFSAASFKSTLSFEGARFEMHPPNFNGASLYEGTIWPEAEGWPAAPADGGYALDHRSCYERLKKDAETHKKHRQEQFFFAKELECQQVIDGPWRGWPTKLYGLLSGYGTSIVRPMTLLVLSWLFGANYMANGVSTQTGDPLSLGQAFALSGANLLAVLPIRKDVFGEDFLKGLAPLTHVISIGQMIIGLLCLFLIGLALRNRFRMK